MAASQKARVANKGPDDGAQKAAADVVQIEQGPSPITSRFYPPDKLNLPIEDVWRWCKSQTPYHVHIRGQPLKSRPKREYGIADEDGRLPLYTYGQHRADRGLVQPMPPTLLRLCEAVNARFGARCNHAVVTYYSNGRDNFIPPHQDKAHSKGSTPGVENHTAVYNCVLCESQGERPFRITDADGRTVCEWLTTHGSMVLLTAEDNARLWHSVPKNPSITGLRISVVFREATRKKIDRGTGVSYEWRKGAYKAVKETVVET